MHATRSVDSDHSSLPVVPSSSVSTCRHLSVQREKEEKGVLFAKLGMTSWTQASADMEIQACDPARSRMHRAIGESSSHDCRQEQSQAKSFTCDLNTGNRDRTAAYAHEQHGANHCEPPYCDRQLDSGQRGSEGLKDDERGT